MNMPLFRSKPKIVNAVQFTDEANPPRGVHRKGVEFYVTTKQMQNVTVNIGEWIVDEGGGNNFYPIDDETFKGPKGYEPV